jgi:hypothetical protein
MLLAARDPIQGAALPRSTLHSRDASHRHTVGT